ncbi:MAG TPA: hypothetical protein VD905_05355 [Flavobacteriales bacterium]|nr:hypothetical protein [Flavobacteriales bacterium]
MKRGSRFLIGFAAAAVTFGTLMATLGPQKFGHCSHHWRHHHGHCGHTCYTAGAGNFNHQNH